MRVLVVLALLGCAPEEAPFSSSLPCDLHLSGCRAQIRAELAVILDDEVPDVPVGFISRAQLAEHITGAMAPDARVDALEAEALFRFGFYRQRHDSAEQTLVDELVQGIQAFYSTETEEIVVIEDPERGREIDLFVLAHEYTHAWQDERFDLAELLEGAADDADRFLALQAGVEGHANLAATLVLVEAAGVKAEDQDWTSLSQEADRRSIADLDLAPEPYVSHRVGFPYWIGERGAFALYTEEALGGPIPERLLAEPLPSTAAWLRLWPGRGADYAQLRALERRWPDPSLTEEVVDALQLKHHDTRVIGAWDLALLATPELGFARARDRVLQWAGGVLHIYFRGEDPVFVLDTVWAGEAAARDFVELLREVHAVPSWKAMDPMGRDDEACFHHTGEQVTLVIAPEAALLSPLGFAPME